MFTRLGKRAQTTAEYAILIAIVVGAVVAMQVYVRRGLQGRIHDAVNYTGDVPANTTFNFSGNQYEPYYMASESASSQLSNQQENLTRGGGVSRDTRGASGQARQVVTGWETTDTANTQTAPTVTLP